MDQRPSVELMEKLDELQRTLNPEQQRAVRRIMEQEDCEHCPVAELCSRPAAQQFKALRALRGVGIDPEALTKELQAAAEAVLAKYKEQLKQQGAPYVELHSIELAIGMRAPDERGDDGDEGQEDAEPGDDSDPPDDL